MDPIISFLTHHWILSAILFVLAIAFFLNEWRMQVVGMRGVSAQELVNMMNHSQVVLIDIRDPEAFVRGHILGAENIAQSTIVSKLKLLSQYKTKPLILICGAGVDAPKYQSLLKKEGFSHFYYLVGGMNGWQSNGMPVVKH